MKNHLLNNIKDLWLYIKTAIEFNKNISLIIFIVVILSASISLFIAFNKILFLEAKIDSMNICWIMSGEYKYIDCWETYHSENNLEYCGYLCIFNKGNSTSYVKLG